MRYAMSLGGTRGDIQPYVDLGIGLLLRGHEVVLAAPSEFEDLIVSAGLEFRSVSLSPRKLVGEQLERGERNFRFALRLPWAVTPELDRVIQEYDDALSGADFCIYSAVGFLGREIARARGITAAGALYAPLLVPTSQHPHPYLPAGASSLVFSGEHQPRLTSRVRALYNRLSYNAFNGLLFHLLRPAVDRALKRNVRDIPGLKGYGLSGPFADLSSGRDLMIHGYSKSVIPEPQDWPPGAVVTGYWSGPVQVSCSLPTSLETFLDSGPTPISIGFGSMSGKNPGRLRSEILKALEITGHRAVLMSGWGGIAKDTRELNGLGDRVYVADELPHDSLFPRVAAAVHHGGAGTTGASLHAGVPTIVIPFFADQGFWGARVADIGAGPAPIPRRKLTASKLARAIDAATTDERIKATAAGLGEYLRSNSGTELAVDMLERAAEASASR